MLIFCVWLISIIIACVVLEKHNCAGTGFLLGFILGPIGAIIAMVISSSKTNKLRDKQHNELISALSKQDDVEDVHLPPNIPTKPMNKEPHLVLIFAIIISAIVLLWVSFRV